MSITTFLFIAFSFAISFAISICCIATMLLYIRTHKQLLHSQAKIIFIAMTIITLAILIGGLMTTIDPIKHRLISYFFVPFAIFVNIMLFWAIRPQIKRNNMITNTLLIIDAILIFSSIILEVFNLIVK